METQKATQLEIPLPHEGERSDCASCSIHLYIDIYNLILHLLETIRVCDQSTYVYSGYMGLTYAELYEILTRSGE